MTGKEKRVFHREWTRREINLLKRLYPCNSNRVVGERMGRSEADVCRKAFRLGIRKDWGGGYHRPSTWPAEKPYTEEEMRQLREMCANTPFREIVRRLGRGIRSVKRKIRELGLGPRPKAGEWTRGEVRLLKHLYPLGNTKDVARRLKRSPEAVKLKAMYLGTRKDIAGGFRPPPRGRRVEEPYTEAEIQHLRDVYAERKPREIAQKLGRGVMSIRAKIREFGLGRKSRPGAWSSEEIEQLKNMYAESSRAEIAAALGRTVSSVGMKVSKLGLAHLIVHHRKGQQTWTQAEDAILRQRYLTSKLDELAWRLGKSPCTVKKRALKLRILKQVRWTSEETELVRHAAVTCPNETLAARLGRTVESVNTKRKRLGVRRRRLLWTDRDIAMLRKYYPMESDSRVARMLGRGQETIRVKAKNLGLRKSPYARTRPNATTYRNVRYRRVRRG